jgi:hypothetical protein
VLLVTQGVEGLEHKLEQSLEVLGVGRGDEDVRVVVGQSRTDRETESSRLSATTAGRQRDGGREGLLRDRLDEGKEGLGLEGQLSR